MKKFNKFLGYVFFGGSIALFGLTSLLLYYLEIQNVVVVPSTSFGTGVMLTFLLVFSANFYKKITSYPKKDHEAIIDRQRKHIYFLESVAIPRFMSEIHKLQSVVRSYEQTLAQYKGIINLLSTNTTKSITTQLGQSLTASNENKYAIFKLKHNIKNILNLNNTLLSLTKIQQKFVNTFPEQKVVKNKSKPKVNSYSISNDYAKLFDSIQQYLKPKHYFVDMENIFKKQYSEKRPFVGEKYLFYFDNNKITKEKIDRSYKGEIESKTLEKEYSIYRQNKKKKF